MSLTSIRMICDVTAEGRDTLLAGFFTQRQSPQGLYFRGDKNALEFYGVRPSLSALRPWDPAPIDAANLRLGVGDEDLPPTGGTFSLAYDGDSTGLTGLDHDISAVDLQTAINANPEVVNTGDTVAVELLADGVYQITWQSNGVRLLFAGDPEGLQPESNVFVSRFQTGDAGKPDIQAVQLVQRPYVYVDEWTDTSAAAAAVNTIREGDGSTRAMHQITLSPLPYDGTWTIETTDGVSDAIAYDATAESVAEALAGDWSAVKTGDGNWTIERMVTGASALADGNIDVSGLSVFQGLTGKMKLNTSGLFRRFLDEPERTFTSRLEVRHDDGTDRDTILSVPVTLAKEILSAGGIAPVIWPGGGLTLSDAIDMFVQFVSAPANATDFSMLPGAVAPTAGQYRALTATHEYSIAAGETAWKRAPRANF